MTVVVAWLIFPVVFGLLCLGCGLLLRRASGLPVPAALLLPSGFVVLSLATQFVHLSDTTAGFGAPLCLALAIAGYRLSFQRRRPIVEPWLVVTGVAVFAVFAAPIVLSGSATFAGYMKLDDIANYFAMIDRGAHHGYNVGGLAPASYETYLSLVYVFGYPLGSVLPLGIGSTLVGQDIAWVWQPYLAFMAVLVGLTLYHLVSSVVGSPRLRALVAFFGAQCALTYGYALWGGVKELATAFITLLIASLVPLVVRAGNPRAVLPLAVASAALVGVLSVGGAVWLFVPLAAAAAFALATAGIAATVRMSVAFVAATCALAIPVFAAAGPLLNHAGAYTSSKELANLQHKLSWYQVFGIWPAGDFRTETLHKTATYLLIAVVAIAALGMIWLAWERRAWDVLAAAGTVAFACGVYLSKGSPWIGGKALASSGPTVVGLAAMGAAVVFETRRRLRLVALTVACLIGGGIIWSNVLQYHNVYLAPSARLAELAKIGETYAGDGPALMTEFSIYGDRHFLRNIGTEGVSDLRRATIPLATGDIASVGESPDIDEIQTDAVLAYPTLVLPASGVASRPPANYKPVYLGRFYQVWRSAGSPMILTHHSLGTRLQPAAVPPCSTVLNFAALATASHGLLATVVRPPAIVIQPNGTTSAPTVFGSYGESATVIHPTGAFALKLPFTAPAGNYGLWAAGTFRASLTLSIDGTQTGGARGQLDWPGTFYPFGSASLAAGPHVLGVDYSGANWRPGSAGPQFGLGPFVVAQGTEDRPVTFVKPANARSLCGKSLDWIEVVQQ